jgi:hypothetical protein
MPLLCQRQQKFKLVDQEVALFAGRLSDLYG